MRGFEALQPFYWSLNWTFFVQWSYEQTYLFEYGRMLGVVMISIQRCATVSFPHSRFNQVRQKFTINVSEKKTPK
ncbi:unnamed protein product [Heligmosomoides polygyrus]|uniref:GPI mannosyltransferase 2 n=1 Tax=Heligmosomoides polygyrus TaxID=6339 RepID=A0A183GPX8_HELPZ|nr:unnamed protein product [Heligmosomoides polygyrus]